MLSPKHKEPNQSLQTISCSVTVAAEPLYVPPHEMSDLKRSAKMKPRPKDLFIVVSLAIIAGWSSASAFMAYFMWLENPEKKAMLIEASRESGFIFMPPLFGDSPAFYITCTAGLAIACFLIVLYMRLKRKEAAEPGATDNDLHCHGSCSEQHAPRQRRSRLT